MNSKGQMLVLVQQELDFLGKLMRSWALPNEAGGKFLLSTLSVLLKIICVMMGQSDPETLSTRVLFRILDIFLK